jgi:hypothetical protein
MASITTAPSILRVDRGGVGRTRISYTTDWQASFELFMWQRYVGSSWKPIKSLKAEVVDPSNYLKEGEFFRNLKPGQAYQVRMYHEGYIDPERSELPPDAEAKAVAILKGGPSDLILDSKTDVGGTYVRLTVTTRVDTVAFLWVGTKPPVADADGFQRLPEVFAGAYDGARGQDHALEVASHTLLPGNSFHAVLLVVDAEGRWQMKHVPFETKQRRVEIVFDEIHVINDAGEVDNEARFTHYVLQGDRVRSSCTVPELKITDQPDNASELAMEFVDLTPFCGTVVLGPEQITNDNARVAILTRGLAKDWPDKDEPAGNYRPGPAPKPSDPPDKFSGKILSPSDFPFPIGSHLEAVDDQPLVVVAKPLVAGDELEYSVRVFVSVEYV